MSEKQKDRIRHLLEGYCQTNVRKFFPQQNEYLHTFAIKKLEMKRFLFCSLVAFAMTATAQDTDKNVSLNEVTVNGARIIQKVDGQWIYPTKQQIENSPNGYSLLAKLSLPHIRVDEAMNSITALTNLGTVQVRINDVIASREDLQTLDMQGIERIEFIDNPGVRYGEDIAYVINIKVKKAASGYVVGSQLTNTLTTINGNESIFAKVNHGLSELAFSYNLDYRNFKGMEYDEQARYELESGDIVSIHRKSLNQQSKNLTHNAQITYSLSDSNYVFQAKLSGKRDIKPQRDYSEMAVDEIPYDEVSSSRNTSPSLDLYYHQDFHRHQSLTANIVGTYTKTTSDVENNEGYAYQYASKGKMYSLWNEAIYENQLKPFTVSCGLQFLQRYRHDVYSGDINVNDYTHISELYIFSQLKGQLKKLSYVGGLVVSRRYYRQGDAHHNFWLFRPKFSVAYSLSDDLKLNYGFEIYQHVSQVVTTNDVSIKKNAMETILGNPDIRPNRVTSHQLKLSYSTPHFTSELQGYYRLNAHCNMEKYIRKDDHFYYTQTNADNDCRFFYFESYNQYDIIPQKFTASVYGGIYRFFNFGDGYTHTYTSFNGGCSLQAYLGRWTLGAYADNGWNFMEGEHRGHQTPAWYFTCNYRLNEAFAVALYLQHPFCQNPLTNKTEIVSRYVQKELSQHYRDYGNMLTLKLSWRLDRGRKYRDIHRTVNYNDSGTNVL